MQPWSVHCYMVSSVLCASPSICLVVAWAGQSSKLLLLHHYTLTKQLRYMYVLTIQVQLCVTIGGYVQYVMEVFVK